MIYRIKGWIIQKGTSTNYLPIKYDKAEYNFEFSSLKNTSLSTAKPSTTYIILPIAKLTHRKYSDPAIFLTSDIVSESFAASQNTPPCNNP